MVHLNKRKPRHSLVYLHICQSFWPIDTFPGTVPGKILLNPNFDWWIHSSPGQFFAHWKNPEVSWLNHVKPNFFLVKLHQIIKLHPAGPSNVASRRRCQEQDLGDFTINFKKRGSNQWTMDFIWISYGFHMDFIWILYGFYMDFIWISYGFHMDFISDGKWWKMMEGNIWVNTFFPWTSGEKRVSYRSSINLGTIWYRWVSSSAGGTKASASNLQCSLFDGCPCQNLSKFCWFLLVLTTCLLKQLTS